MKKLRFLLVTTIITVFAVAIMAFAKGDSIDYKAKRIDVTLHGYIDFLEGPLWTADKYWCNGMIYGKDLDLMTGLAGDCRATITIETNKSKYSCTKYLRKNNKSVSMTNVSCGYGNTMAILKLNNCGKERTISARD